MKNPNPEYGVFKHTDHYNNRAENVKLGKYYVRGVGVGLIIAWATSALAYWKAGGSSTDVALIGLEFILSIIFLAISVLMKDKAR